jgi:hypothetical protein
VIDSILAALGLRPTLRIGYVAPLSRAPLIRSPQLTQPSGLPVYLAPFPWARLTRLHPAFSPFGLPVHLIASPHFDKLRRPANLALQVTFGVIYPAAPA